jgi:hypothetical protein
MRLHVAQVMGEVQPVEQHRGETAALQPPGQHSCIAAAQDGRRAAGDRDHRRLAGREQAAQAVGLVGGGFKHARPPG